MKYKLWIVLSSLLVMQFGCNGDNGEEDTLTDPDSVDTDSDDAGTEPDPVEVDGELPACPALTIAYQDVDEEPLAGLSVILEAGGLSVEGTTDSTGRVTLEGLDTCGQSAMVTAVGETFAHTMTDVGPWDTPPDPLVVTVRATEVPPPSTAEFSGSVQRTQAGSSVLISAATPGGRVNTDDAYTLSCPDAGSNLPLSAFEYTLTIEGDPASPLAYTFMRYDVPPEGESGPDIVLEAAAFSRASVEVTYDIAAESVFQDVTMNEMNRGNLGVRLFGRDGSGWYWLAGFTTQWTQGAGIDTLSVEWPDAALTEAVEQFLTLELMGITSPGPICYVSINLPPDPSNEDTFSATVYDPVLFTGLDGLDPMAFEADHPLTVPPVYGTLWVAAYTASIDDAPIHIWHIETPASRTSINFSSLPWPADVDLSEFMFPADSGASMQIYGFLAESTGQDGYTMCSMFALAPPL